MCFDLLLKCLLIVCEPKWTSDEENLKSSLHFNFFFFPSSAKAVVLSFDLQYIKVILWV